MLFAHHLVLPRVDTDIPLQYGAISDLKLALKLHLFRVLFNELLFILEVDLLFDQFFLFSQSNLTDGVLLHLVLINGDSCQRLATHISY